MHVERLKRLIRIMERVRDEEFKFNMASWVSTDDDCSDVKCGTSCCALGWAALDPENNAEGLMWVRRAIYDVNQTPLSSLEELASFYITHTKSFVADSDPAKIIFTGDLDCVFNLDVGAKFFELSDIQTKALFLPNRMRDVINLNELDQVNYNEHLTPNHVIFVINAILKRKI